MRAFSSYFKISSKICFIELCGIALSVTRNYDSINKKKEDFGYGWTMGLQGLKLYESNPLYDGYDLSVFGKDLVTNYVLSQTKKHNITVNYGNGKVDRFKMLYQQFQETAKNQNEL